MLTCTVLEPHPEGASQALSSGRGDWGVEGVPEGTHSWSKQEGLRVSRSFVFTDGETDPEQDVVT